MAQSLQVRPQVLDSHSCGWEAGCVPPTIDPVVSLLIGAFGAASLALVGGFFGASIQSRREHDRWIREIRFDAYKAFLVAIDSAVSDDNQTMAIAVTKWRGIQEAQGGVRLVGPKEMEKAASEWIGAALQYQTICKPLEDFHHSPSHATAKQILQSSDHLEESSVAFALAARDVLKVPGKQPFYRHLRTSEFDSSVLAKLDAED